MKHVTLLAASLMLATSAYAQHAHQSHVQNNVSATANIETGQAAFAAIAEIVEILKNDPTTDWSKVNIQDLRDHLIDMNNVTMNSNVSITPIKGGAIFIVTGSADIASSIQRMTSAHSKVLAGDIGFAMNIKTLPNGVEMTVKSTNMNEEAYIQSLGFYGIMTVGAHHQQHHLMMAKGEHPH